MSVHAAFVGQTVQIEIDNGGNPNGFFGCEVLSETPTGLVVRCSKGGVMTDIEIPDARIVTIG